MKFTVRVGVTTSLNVSSGAIAAALKRRQETAAFHKKTARPSRYSVFKKTHLYAINFTSILDEANPSLMDE
jgi:hypothetical protein